MSIKCDISGNLYRIIQLLLFTFTTFPSKNKEKHWRKSNKQMNANQIWNKVYPKLLTFCLLLLKVLIPSEQNQINLELIY